MKRIIIIRKLLFVISVLLVCLPWFTYSSDIMGYSYGFYYIDYFLIPLVIIALDIFGVVKKKNYRFISIIASLALAAIWFYVGSVWQNRANIVGGLHPEDIINTALPGYYLFGILAVIGLGLGVAMCVSHNDC